MSILVHLPGRRRCLGKSAICIDRNLRVGACRAAGALRPQEGGRVPQKAGPTGGRNIKEEQTTRVGAKAPLPRQQRLGEEIANSIAHGVGAALSLAALVILVVLSSRYGDPWRIVSFSIYGATLFFLYLASTLYHSFSNRRVKRVFRVLDHSSIYLLIAGTYTPVTLISMRGPWGWTIFGLIWGLAVCGIVAKVFLMGKYRVFSVLLYVAMGWLIVPFGPALAMISKGLMVWILIGGLSYTLGLIFYGLKSVPYFHFVWHLFVLGGSVSHFFGILLYLT